MHFAFYILVVVIAILAGPVAFCMVMGQRNRLQRLEERCAHLETELHRRDAAPIAQRAPMSQAPAAAAAPVQPVSRTVTPPPPAKPTAAAPIPLPPVPAPELFTPALRPYPRGWSPAYAILRPRVADIPAMPPANGWWLRRALTAMPTATAAPTGMPRKIPDLAAPVTPKVKSGKPASGLDAVEELYGRKLLTWAGIGILFLAGAFLLRLAYDSGWVGHFFTPPVRIATLLVTAVGALVWGGRSLRKQHGPLGQGLLGGGLGLLALTIFAAYKPGFLLPDNVALIGPVTAFAGLAATSALGFGLSWWLRAAALAHIALLCGFATPIMISTGSGSREGLCTWLLLLDIGALVTAAWHRWRGLSSVAAAGTALLISAWIFKYGTALPQPDWATIAWLLAFQGLLLSVAVIGFRRHTSEAVPVQHLLLPLGGAIAVLAASSALFGDGFRSELAAIATVLAAMQAVQTYFALRHIPTARTVGTVATISLLNLALFLHLPGDAATWGWAVESAALASIGWRLRLPYLRNLAGILIVLTWMRGAHVAFPAIVDTNVTPMLNAWFLTLAALPTCLAARAIIDWIWTKRLGGPRHWAILAIISGHTWGALLAAEVIRVDAFAHIPGFPEPLPLALIAAGVASVHALIAYRWRIRRAWLGSLPWLALHGLALIAAYFSLQSDQAWLFHLRSGVAIFGLGVFVLLIRAAKNITSLGATTAARCAFFTGQLAVLLAAGETLTWSLAHPGSRSGTTILLTAWTVVTGAALHGAVAWIRRSTLTVWGAMPPLVLGGILLLAAYCFRQEWALPLANPRALLAIAIIGIGLAICPRLSAQHRLLALRVLAGSGLIAATLEAACWPVQTLHNDRIALLAVTGTWSVLGILSLIAGMRKDRRNLRLAGLVVLAAAIAKLLLIDLHGIAPGQRIIATLMVGVICLAGGAAYQGLGRRRLRQEIPAIQPEDSPS